MAKHIRSEMGQYLNFDHKKRNPIRSELNFFRNHILFIFPKSQSDPQPNRLSNLLHPSDQGRNRLPYHESLVQ